MRIKLGGLGLSFLKQILTSTFDYLKLWQDNKTTILRSKVEDNGK